MLKIKLARIGKKAQPQYHVVVVEAKTNSGTRPTAKIGFYNPLVSPKDFRLDYPAYESWLAKGARPTDTLRQLALKYSAKPPLAPPKAKKSAPKSKKSTK